MWPASNYKLSGHCTFPQCALTGLLRCLLMCLLECKLSTLLLSKLGELDSAAASAPYWIAREPEGMNFPLSDHGIIVFFVTKGFDEQRSRGYWCPFHSGKVPTGKEFSCLDPIWIASPLQGNSRSLEELLCAVSDMETVCEGL